MELERQYIRGKIAVVDVAIFILVLGVLATVIGVILALVLGIPTLLEPLGIVFLGSFIGSTVLLLISFALSEQVHDLSLVVDHLHADSCTKTGKVTLIEQKTHTEIAYSGSTWGPNVMTFVDYERMQCSECGTITRWVPGKTPERE